MSTDPTTPADLEDLIAQLPQLADGQDPAPYPHQAEVVQDGQDDLDELGGPGDAPNTSWEALKLAKQWIAEGVWIGVGYCLRTIRSLYGVPALYPDAETAWEEADRKHPQTDPAKIPWGVPVFWTNGRYGHIAFSIGHGRCITTDYVATGKLGVAPIAALGPWCGGRLVGWTNDLNGVDVWEPDAKKPAAPKKWTARDRRDFLKRALDRNLERDVHDHNQLKIQGLRRWIDRIDERLAEK